ncbi:MAG: NfeD family protein, partial [Sphingomonadales bacterium]
EKEVPSEDNTLNRRGQQYVGKICEVVVPFKNGKGKIKIEDTLWTAIGPNKLDKGESVRVVGLDGTRIKVEVVK